MEYREQYQQWKTYPHLPESLKEELDALKEEIRIKERFHKYLDFGTAGMRGLMGTGTNRMNQFIVRRATKGFADFLIAQNLKAKKDGVVIAYDSRNNSRIYAMEAARVLAAAGINVYIFDCFSPVPLLSFTITYLGCTAGIAITASHNAKEYNGYKVYDHTGCQLVPGQVETLVGYINNIQDLFSIPVSEENDQKIQTVGGNVIEAFLDRILKSTEDIKPSGKQNLNIVYTPLHGAGMPFVPQLLQKAGFTQVSIVKEQANPDGNFPTVDQPNPEDKGSLTLAINRAKKEKADLVFGTDPDADRIGAAVLHRGEYHLINGNEMGALLVDYLTNAIKQPKNQTLLKSIVTNNLGGEIARKKGVKVLDTLIGFKYIGQQMNKLDGVLMGYEESYGYLIGTHAKDKDAISTALYISQMTAFHKAQGKTLIDVLESLYKTYGFYLDRQESFFFPGIRGENIIQEMMARLRTESKPPFGGVKEVQDYAAGYDGLPPANLIKYIFDNSSWLAIRPSGTEPKIKVYYSIKKDNKKEAQNYFHTLQKIIQEKIITVYEK